ncbi:MAG: hypothetical protein ACFNVT_12915, partial [Corynebacterium matruchotii]|uniref:hypothetical protein n=1 Tax=Corynebacterium matruchotii TaxID=43768 RepID=UPI003611B529
DAHQVIATGSCYATTLRCFAVDDAHQGKGLLNNVLTHLMNVQQHSEGRANESVDELEMEANFNETLRLHNGEEVRYVEYALGKYWATTEKEYKRFLNQVAAEFESEAEGKLRSMTDAEQLEYLLSLQEWANDPFDEPFSLRRW